jgi:hypothetical protein
MKRHFKLSFLLKLLILIVILSGLFVLHSQGEQNGADKTVSNYKPIPVNTNNNPQKSPEFNTPSTGVIPITENKRNKPEPIHTQKKIVTDKNILTDTVKTTQENIDHDVKKDDLIKTKPVNGLKNISVDKCHNYNYSDLIIKYNLDNDFRYILQLYCEDIQKENLEPYILINSTYNLIKDTSYIRKKEKVLATIEQLQSEWSKIVSE